MLEYPKIDNLFKRKEDSPNRGKYVEGDLCRPEFLMIDKWHVVEKIDGTNVRVYWDGENVTFAARTASSDALHKDLQAFLRTKFTPETMTSAFGCLGDEKNPSSYTPVQLFGEGCGPGIQKNGASYSSEKFFVLFDVFIGNYWLEPENITKIAKDLDILEAPVIGEDWTLEEINLLVKRGFHSPLSLQNTGTERLAEGIIARTAPGLYMRNHKRLMFKLKTLDYPNE